MMMRQPSILIKQLIIVFSFCLALTFVGYLLASSFADFLSTKHTARYLAGIESQTNQLWETSMSGVSSLDLRAGLASQPLDKFGLQLVRNRGVRRVEIYGDDGARLWTFSDNGEAHPAAYLGSEQYQTVSLNLRGSSLLMNLPVGLESSPTAVVQMLLEPDFSEAISLVYSKTFVSLLALIIFGVLMLYVIFNRLNRPYKLLTQELSSVLAATPQGIATLDGDLKIISTNQRFKKLCGSSEELVGMSLIRLCPGTEGNNLLPRFKKALRAGKGEGDISRVLGKKTLVYHWEIAALPVDAVGEKRFLFLLDDVTQTKILWSRLASHQKELEKKNEFLGIVLHQIRSPLADVRWLAESLRDNDFGRLNKGQSESVKEIEGSIKRLSETISGLTALFGIESESLDAVKDKPGDIIQVTRDVIADLQMSINSKELKVEVSTPPQVPFVKLDSALLRQVVLNYLVNAIRYSNKKGSIKIQFGVTPEGVRFEVADEGIGIPKKEQKNLFNKFYRATNAIQAVPDGSGLGLALVKSILNFCSGSYGFSSVEDKGSVFYALIPIFQK